MGIGTSLGNYYPDEHAYQARDFNPDARGGSVGAAENNVINPDQPDKGMFSNNTDRFTLDKNIISPEQEYRQSQTDPNAATPISDVHVYSMNPMLDTQAGTRPMVGGGTPPAPERVGAAALQIQGKTYTGVNHGEAFEKFMNENPEGDYSKFKDGFMTTHDRFVSREEAFDLAKKQGQVDPQVLKSLPEGQEGSMLLSEDVMQMPVQQQQAKAGGGDNVSNFRSPANENFAPGNPKRPYNIQDPTMIGSDAQDAHIDAMWKKFGEDQRAADIKSKADLSRGMELIDAKSKLRDILVDRDWNDIELARYNKLDKEHHELLGRPFTPMPK